MSLETLFGLVIATFVLVQIFYFAAWSRVETINIEKEASQSES